MTRYRCFATVAESLFLADTDGQQTRLLDFDDAMEAVP